MKLFQDVLALLARLLLALIFLKAGLNKIIDPLGTQAYMSSYGIPLTKILLAATISVLMVGGLSILLGIKTRVGTLLLVGFLIPATLIFHTDFPKGETAFLKNLGLMGGLLAITAHGPGPFSLDHWLKKSLNRNRN